MQTHVSDSFYLKIMPAVREAIAKEFKELGSCCARFLSCVLRELM
jgi:hypothetical protein